LSDLFFCNIYSDINVALSRRVTDEVHCWTDHWHCDGCSHPNISCQQGVITSMQQISNRIMLLLSETSIKTQLSALDHLPSIKNRCFLRKFSK